VDPRRRHELRPNEGGYLVIKKPWPSMLRTIFGDDQRYKDTYWTSSTASITSPGTARGSDEDGYFWIVGRIDDVLNVAGHRLGTAEIESALVSHPAVARPRSSAAPTSSRARRWWPS
jgi:acetyl-CoA synthetase